MPGHAAIEDVPELLGSFLDGVEALLNPQDVLQERGYHSDHLIEARQVHGLGLDVDAEVDVLGDDAPSPLRAFRVDGGVAAGLGAATLVMELGGALRSRLGGRGPVERKLVLEAADSPRQQGMGEMG